MNGRIILAVPQQIPHVVLMNLDEADLQAGSTCVSLTMRLFPSIRSSDGIQARVTCGLVLACA